MMDRLAKFGADLGLGAPTGLGPQRRGGRLPPHRGVVPRAEAQEPEGRGLPDRPGGQRRHRPGVDARDAAADGDAVRGDRQRRQAVAAADRASGSRSPDGQVLEEFAPRVRRELAVVARDAWRSCARRWSASSTSRRGRRTRRAPKDIEVAGKTGTAQVQQRARPRAATSAATHAWFVGFAPGGAAAHRVRGAGRARRPRRRRRGAAGHGDRRQLLRDRRARRSRGAARRAAAPARAAAAGSRGAGGSRRRRPGRGAGRGARRRRRARGARARRPPAPGEAQP